MYRFKEFDGLGKTSKFILLISGFTILILLLKIAGI